MADYSSPNRVGRFGFRTPAPIITFVQVNDRRSDQGPAVGRAEIPDEHVAMPVSVTDGVVTKIETIVERVYRTSATAYSDGFTTNGEVIESYATIEGVQGKYRTPLPYQTSKMNEFINKVHCRFKQECFAKRPISTPNIEQRRQCKDYASWKRSWCK